MIFYTVQAVTSGFYNNLSLPPPPDPPRPPRSDASLELCVMPKDEDILQLVSTDSSPNTSVLTSNLTRVCGNAGLGGGQLLHVFFFFFFTKNSKSDRERFCLISGQNVFTLQEDAWFHLKPV